jgi:hypothetical protein
VRTRVKVSLTTDGHLVTLCVDGGLYAINELNGTGALARPQRAAAA